MDEQTPEALHLRATILPFGAHPRDLWIADGRFSFEQVSEARSLADADGYVMSGLVDSHSHVTIATTGEPGSAETVETNARAQIASGVTLIRDIGAWNDQVFRVPPPLRAHVAGPFIAPPGGFLDGYARWVEAADVEAVIDGYADAGARWVKIIGDWRYGDQMRMSYPPETYGLAARAARARNLRIAVHAHLRETIEVAIEAGVDSIEHAVGVDHDLLARMARRSIAWTPTLTAVEMNIEALRQRGDDAGVRRLQDILASRPELFRAAKRLDVAVLAGTDVHLPISREIGALHRHGMTIADALAAASTRAREFLGQPGIEPGAPADLVWWRRDPRSDASILAAPDMVLIGGVRVA